MKTDIKINTETESFKFRVGGIVIVDNKVLGVQICKNGFYCLPGGHVEIGTDTKEATLRELEEEIGAKFEINELLCIIESFFTRKDLKKFHELGFYYTANPIGEIRLEDYTVIEHDKDGEVQLDFKWIPLDEIDNYDFRPAQLKEILKNKNLEFNHIITRD